MKNVIRNIIITTALLSSLIFGQLDNSELMELSIEELLNVEIVTSNKKNEKIIETPFFVNVISDKEIEMLNFTNLQEVLEYVTGISSVNGEGNIFNTTTIRGNTLINYNTNTLLLVDGIPIYSPYGGSFDLSYIPLSSIKRVEIVKGSNSVLYGTNAVNATINILTKELPNYKNNYSKGKVLYGTYNTLYGNANISGRSNDFEYSGFVDFFSTEGESLEIKDEKENEIGFSQNINNIAFIGKIKYKDFFTFHFQTFNRNLPNFRTRGFQNVVDEEGKVNFIPHRNNEFGVILNGTFNYPLTDKQSLHFRSELYKWKLNRENLYSTWNYTSTLFSNDFEYKFDIDSAFSNIIGSSFNVLNARRYKSNISDYDIGKDNELTFELAFYLNGSYRISEGLKLFYGGRYYRSSYKDVVFADFSKRMALTYGISKRVFLKINYGESFRVPTYFEKEVNSDKVLGNPNLFPEKSRSIDFVFSHIFSKMKFDVDFFYTRINDKITRVLCVDDSTKTTNQNIGIIEFSGVEIDSKFQFCKSFWGFAGYAYTIGKDEETQNKLKFTYRNMFNLGFEAKIEKRIIFTNSLKYLDKWGDATAYFVVNSGLRISPFNNSLFKINIQINNLLNTKIDLPEIARNNEIVPTIPKTYERKLFLGATYGL